MNSAVADNPLQRIKQEIRADAEQARARAAQGELRSGVTSPITLAILAERRNHYTIEELSRQHYTDFIEQAYFALLRRSPDSSGHRAQIRLLERGRSKIEILGNLRFSAEGREIGVRVPWLLPRYLLAKATAIPLLGYAVELLMCIAGLPRILRHQRGADAYHAARNIELRQALGIQVAENAALHEEIDRLEGEHSGLVAQLQQTSERFVPVHAELSQAFNEIRDLRHLLMSLNHWQASLRQNLSEMEVAEADQMRRRDGLNIDVSTRMLASDKSRASRVEQWTQLFADDLPDQAKVLDIGSGLDWLQSLTACNLSITGVDASNRAGQRAGEVGIKMAIADPSSVLARIADHSLDAVSILDIAPLLRSVPTLALLEILRRVLRPHARLLIGFAQEHGSIINRLEGHANVHADADLIEHALEVSGFVDIKRHSSSDGMHCVVASNAGNDRA
ncbi:MAG TPA: hypothetical protein VFN25_08635 [Dokdonella sp.]|uniref:hypothetical protein n=1 Tax=Dokdonella sp. TaxID=2291710 RepID=UPI002D7FAF4E|nr:hypothetical protein [Dokdonella sp.]HET9032958.1 hypothetical protein [Dokdonella sp.]